MSSRHASDGARRGIAPWIIVTIVTALVVAAAVVGYVLVVRGGDDSAASNACTSEVILPVVASPGSSAAIIEAASAFDATNPVARSACVTTAVTTMPGADAELALAGGWTARSSPAPAVWVPDSEADLLALEKTSSALTAGRDPDPLATSPVVLAVRTGNAGAMSAAGLSWKSLPAATGPDGAVVLPSGDHLVVALPGPTNNRATGYALQSVVAAAGGAPVTSSKVTAAAPLLTAVAAGGPVPQPALTQDALGALVAGKGGFTAVPVVHSDLQNFTAATAGLTAVSPSGATAGDAVYAAALTAAWVTPALDDAAALFLGYLRGTGGAAAFTKSGMQPASAPTLADAGTAVDKALARAIG